MSDIEEFEEELESALEEEMEGSSESDRGGREVAREIVEENGIETTDYINFQALMDSRGFSREETKEHWEALRGDGTIVSGEYHEEEGVEEQEPPTIGELVGDVDPENVEDIHLFVVEGCGNCKKFKEQMKEPIEKGALQVQNITEDDEAVDLAQKWEVDRTPLLVIEREEGDILTV